MRGYEISEKRYLVNMTAIWALICGFLLMPVDEKHHSSKDNEPPEIPEFWQQKESTPPDGEHIEGEIEDGMQVIFLAGGGGGFHG